MDWQQPAFWIFLMNLHEAYKKVLNHFYGNKEKTFEWFDTPQFKLNHKSPNALIQQRKSKKVIEFIIDNFN